MARDRFTATGEPMHYCSMKQVEKDVLQHAIVVRSGFTEVLSNG